MDGEKTATEEAINKPVSDVEKDELAEKELEKVNAAGGHNCGFEDGT